MGFINLFIVALVPVLKVMLITGVGLLIALDRINLLGPEANHHLNNIVFYVVSPALAASSLAESITYESFINLWFMPVNLLLTFIIGSIFAWLLLKITKTPKHLHGIVIGCCSAGNTGNLPLIMVPAVCEEPSNPFGDPSLCAANARPYASLSLAIGGIYLWSYVYGIMRLYANKGIENGSTSASETDPRNSTGTELAVLPSTTDSHSIQIRPTTSSLNVQEFLSLFGFNILLKLGFTGSALFFLTWKTFAEDKHTFADSMLLDYITWTRVSVSDIGICLARLSFSKTIIQRMKIISQKVDLKKVFAPTAIGAVVGFIIGVVTPIRKLLIGNSAPLRAIDSSAYILGEATIPLMTLVMGANLLSGLKASDVSRVVIIGILVVRNILLPLAGIGIVKAANHFGIVGSDPLYHFVLLLQYAVPPAMAVGTITQFFQLGQGETSVIMLWTYVVAALTLTLWSTCFMWILA